MLAALLWGQSLDGSTSLVVSSEIRQGPSGFYIREPSYIWWNHIFYIWEIIPFYSCKIQVSEIWFHLPRYMSSRCYTLDPKIFNQKMPRRLRPNLGEASSIRTTGSWFPKALDQLLVVIIIPSMLSSDWSHLHLPYTSNEMLPPCQGWGIRGCVPKKWGTHQLMVSS